MEVQFKLLLHADLVVEGVGEEPIQLCVFLAAEVLDGGDYEVDFLGVLRRSEFEFFLDAEVFLEDLLLVEADLQDLLFHFEGALFELTELLQDELLVFLDLEEDVFLFLDFVVNIFPFD